MRNFWYNFLYSIASFLIGMFFILLGIIGLLLPWSVTIKTEIVQFIFENSLAISLFGFGFVVIGVLILTYLYLNSKRRYYYIRGGKKTMAVNEEIVDQYLTSYWKRLFPKSEVPMRLVLKRNRIRIIADLPYVPKLEQESLLQKITEDLQDILNNLLGYSHEFTLAASFAADSTSKDKESKRQP